VNLREKVGHQSPQTQRVAAGPHHIGNRLADRPDSATAKTVANNFMANWNVKISNLSEGTTEEQLSEWLYTTLGLEVGPYNFFVQGTSALAHINSRHIVQLLNRYLCDQHIAGRLVQFSCIDKKFPSRPPA